MSKPVLKNVLTEATENALGKEQQADLSELARLFFALEKAELQYKLKANEYKTKNGFAVDSGIDPKTGAEVKAQR